MTRARFYPLVFTNVNVIDRSKAGAIAKFDFGDLTWGRWGEGSLLAGSPPSATRMNTNAVVGRTLTYQIYHADPSEETSRIADQDEALFYTKIKATTKSARQIVSQLIGNEHLRSTSWDVASRMLSPFETEIGYPLFFLSELVNSPFQKLRALNEPGNIDDVAHPFFFAGELTAHEQIEALNGVQDEIAHYVTVNNWHHRFEIMPFTTI